MHPQPQPQPVSPQGHSGPQGQLQPQAQAGSSFLTSLMVCSPQVWVSVRTSSTMLTQAPPEYYTLMAVPPLRPVLPALKAQEGVHRLERLGVSGPNPNLSATG